MSKSQAKDVLVCDGGSSVEIAGLSGFSAAAAQKLIHSRKIHFNSVTTSSRATHDLIEL